MADHEPFLMRSALQIAASGPAVFPLRPHSKVPALPGWLGKATRDPATIRAWWEQSAFNIGVLTGGDGGVLVVDLDAPDARGEPHGRQTLAVLARDHGETIPRDTRTVSTPSGGQHLYFRLPPGVELRNTAGLLGRHVDTRATGGYVVGPGSIVCGNRYRLIVDTDPQAIPRWLLHLLLPLPRPGSRATTGPRSSAYVQAALRGEAERVERAAVGTRNDTLFRAAARLGRFVADGRLDDHVVVSVLEHACRGHRDFGHLEIDRTIRSGLRRAATSGVVPFSGARTLPADR